MKLILAQINTTPGDFEGNFGKVKTGLEQGKKLKEESILIFPELTLCGYLSKDLFLQNKFIKTNLTYLNRVVKESKKSPKTYVVIGYAGKNTTSSKPAKNMLAVIKNGQILGQYQKQILPYYTIFNEERYFESGNKTLTLQIAGKKYGFAICADIWENEAKRSNIKNPIKDYIKEKIDYLITINSSPFGIGKQEERLQMLGNLAKNEDFGMVYVNQVGGQDSFVFDGQSCVLDKNGFYVKKINNYQQDSYQIVDVDKLKKSPIEPTDSKIESTYKATVTGLKDYINKSGFKKIVVASSGGVDSALTLALACEAVGGKNVHAITMPSVFSSDHSIKDAEKLHQNLGCREYNVPIEHQELLNSVNQIFPKKNYNPIADENIQARLRGTFLMHFSNSQNALALTTGNKSESAVGYCTLYGDMNGGFAPIQDLYKTQVFELCRYINKLHGKQTIPNNIIKKAPSAELSTGQTDEASLLPYPILDRILKSYIEDKICTYEEYQNQEEVSEKDYYRITNLIEKNEFKRKQAAPGIILNNVAFSEGWRMPIIKKTDYKNQLTDRKIAFYGGSFNPPTEAHKKIIKHLLTRTDFDELIVKPCGHRKDKPEIKTDLKIRKNKIEKFFKQAEFRQSDTCYTNLKLDFSEIEKPMTPTLRDYKKLQKKYGENVWFLCGQDLFEEQKNGKNEIQLSWYKGQEVFEKVKFLIFPRKTKNKLILPPNYELVEDFEPINISSTAIRKRGK